MALHLHTIKPAPGSKKSARRIGRGGKRGTYSGRGIKGQRSRSGGKSGTRRRGMRQLIERTHKLKGFKSLYAKPHTVSLGLLSKYFKTGEKVTPQILYQMKLIKNPKAGVKILSTGQIKVKITIVDCALSQSAKAAIEAAGGKVILPAEAQTGQPSKAKKSTLIKKS